MLEKTRALLEKARHGRYAVGAFNVYNFEGALAVIESAQEMRSPVMLQVLPSAVDIAGPALVRMCLAVADSATVPVSVHLDHCSKENMIASSLDASISSVMADGSGFEFEENLNFTNRIVKLAASYNADVEAELGKITGEEDGSRQGCETGRMTQPEQAGIFTEKTGIHALAVCIGNIHGPYKTRPMLDFGRLARIKAEVSVPLVLHGTSGLPEGMITEAIKNGICKFNVNTEIRKAYLQRLNNLFHEPSRPELTRVIPESIDAMKGPIKEKIRLFDSAGKAG